jgi:hypothetical protein
VAAQRYERQLQGLSDNAGNITFPQLPPTAWNLTVYVTLAVVDTGSAGNFVATIADGTKHGPWSGAQPAGPFAWDGALLNVVTGTGLLPNTRYTLQAVGYVDDDGPLIQALSTPTGSTGLVGTDAIAQLTAQLIAMGGTLWPGGANDGTVRAFFPCRDWAALRLSAEVLSGGPIVVECFWENRDMTATMGYRRYILGSDSGRTLQVVIPHLGDALSIKVSA